MEQRAVWDGRVKTLEDQAKGPIQNPIEMNQDPVKLVGELQRFPNTVSASTKRSAAAMDQR